jgi:hypothetical protein
VTAIGQTKEKVFAGIGAPFMCLHTGPRSLASPLVSGKPSPTGEVGIS